MANLKALRQKVKNITDYSPELQQYNDQLDELLNDAYNTIWTKKRWNFATKEYNFKFIPDILPTRDVIAPVTSVTTTPVRGSRQISFSVPMDRLTVENFEGQFITLEDYEYGISKVVSNQEILLDEPYHGPVPPPAGTTNWYIKRRYYDLPHDCIELLTLAHRDKPHSNNGAGVLPPYGKLISLMARKDEQLNLRMDYKASYAEAYVWSPSFYVPEAQNILLTPVDDPGVNSFPVNSYLEVCWAFLRDGQVGSLSEPAIVKFDAGQGGFNTLTIGFKSWDDQDIVADVFQTKDTQPSQFEGLQKIVFWNANFNRTTGERLGLPVWRTFNNPGGSATRNTSTYLDAVTAADTAASVNITNFNQIDPGNTVYIEQDGQYNRIRPYPRVDSFDETVAQAPATNDYSKVPQDFLRYGVARYYYKPSHLGFATDSPEMPYEFHQLICYQALATIYEKVGQLSQSQNYERKIEKEIKQLERRYTDHIDSLIQRGQFGLVGGRPFYYDYNSLRHMG